MGRAPSSSSSHVRVGEDEAWARRRHRCVDACRGRVARGMHYERASKDKGKREGQRRDGTRARMIDDR